MNLCVINASPRGKASNTNQLFEYFTREMNTSNFELYALRDFYTKNAMRELVEKMRAFDSVLIGFPLYTDWLPGFVKELFELIADEKEHFEGKQFLYLIQSGFPEANHSRYVERYCERFTIRIGAVYKGSIVRGNSEGARLIPEKYFKDSKCLSELGKVFDRDNRLDEHLLAILAKPEHFSPAKQFFFKMLASTPLAHVYWHSQLKKNGVFDQRFDKPYTE